ncbi:hypothetical protein NEMBOFW57_004650 [Staphylotrichum longicolle]|uniref:Uncharacterized protein n=1 Tax=Staphylotrichum longicolle TaxID=669026 RepID=A0AAD4I0P1_9PEZI|nr:hypothetical protein NEMBOFW57_004650 [Staphylotrichum longicolle]
MVDDAALARILSTDIAELTFSEIFDGLPTEDSFREFNARMPGNPVFQLEHTSLCPGVTERLLSAFQRSHLGTREFELRLIELLAVACHQIAVYLYILDEGNHKHRLYEEWRETPDAREFPGQYVVPTPFYHSSYIFDQQYPNGVADIVGYWAEANIFGGVVLFDRGESGTECRDLFLHPARFKGPRTIFPLF